MKQKTLNLIEFCNRIEFVVKDNNDTISIIGRNASSDYSVARRVKTNVGEIIEFLSMIHRKGV